MPHVKSTIRKQNAVKPNRNEIIAQLIKNMVYVEGGIFLWVQPILNIHVHATQ